MDVCITCVYPITTLLQGKGRMLSRWDLLCDMRLILVCTRAAFSNAATPTNTPMLCGGVKPTPRGCRYCSGKSVEVIGMVLWIQTISNAVFTRRFCSLENNPRSFYLSKAPMLTQRFKHKRNKKGNWSEAIDWAPPAVSRRVNVNGHLSTAVLERKPSAPFFFFVALRAGRATEEW